MDFYKIKQNKFTSRAKQDVVVQPEFLFIAKDIVCKGGKMHGFWYDGRWRTDSDDLITIVDNHVLDETEDVQKKNQDYNVVPKLMNENGTGIYDDFLKYARNKNDSDVEFNTRIIFADEVPKREDYATTQLSYSPKEGPTPIFDEIFDLLYAPEELDKILWFIGASLTNNMHKIQKFLFLYGGKGSGKGTIISVIKMLFQGYYTGIDLKRLTSNSEFATSGITETQLLIDEDSDLYSIKDDTNLLKLTAHEPIVVNNKFQLTYSVTFKGLLISASNQKFKVRNVDSGITRRGVVAAPTSNTHPYSVYRDLMKKVEFEIPQIAFKAMEKFNEMGSGYYQDYVPAEMLETNTFHNFMLESAVALGDMCTLKQASGLYKEFLDDMEFDTTGYKMHTKNELKRYYKKFHNQKRFEDVTLKNVFEEMMWEKVFPESIDNPIKTVNYKKTKDELVEESGLGEYESAFDVQARTYPAQLATSNELPKSKWDDVSTTLSDIDTNKLHYVMVPINHIVIDFDIKNSKGEKDLLLNIEAASKFPDTYMEVSKSGEGVHLHYLYEGEVEKLAKEYEPYVEIKVFTGKSSLRRKLSLCNDIPIATISTGLPEKEEEFDVYKDIEIIHWNENKMRAAIKGNLEYKYHASTGPSVDFIVKIFEDAQKAGTKYDLQDMRQDILTFAASSTNQARRCMGAVSNIVYTTIEEEVAIDIQKSASGKVLAKEELYFYDVEVFSNLFIVAFKKYGEDKITKWINPTREQIESFVELPLVGFNNRRYDNHIIYAALLGENNASLYRQSQRIIHDKNAGSGMYGAAYELSYTDIYDYCNAGNKKSLKKWEVELGIKHDEFELSWDKPVPEDMWERAAEYCGNDVLATEAVFDHTQSDYNARAIMAELSGLSMNTTTNTHTAAIIFEGKKSWEVDKDLEYTDLSEMFPGYTYSFGKSDYRGENPGEGGYVYAEPGVYENVVLLDVESMHPVSAIAMNAFGKYTKNYNDILQGRLDIKHGDYESAAKRYDGRLAPYLGDVETAGELSDGLKTTINSVYGLTSASFDNHFKHKDNIDNIVAKRGALFMIDLKHAVQEQGYIVAHIKTDSIKIPNADEFIIEFVKDFGTKYGYKFDVEETYSKLALVNKSTYVCQTEDGVWSATGTQFKEQYVFKTLFTKEDLTPADYFVTKEVKNASVYLGEKFIGRLAEVYASQTGDEMFRVTDDKTGSISGTKGFKWKLSNEFGGVKDIDMVYYNELVQKAKDAISKVGDISIMIPELERPDMEELLPMP